jgi:predicted MPP superfamily phosphohydrolase
LLIKVGIAAAGIVGAVIAWGLIEPRLLDVVEREVAIEGLPAAWEGRRVAQLSDWQIGLWLDNTDTVEDAIEVIVREKPALVLLTGDFVYRPDDDDRDEKVDPEDLRTLTRLVKPLSEHGIPTYAVLGNHDYGLAEPEGRPDLPRAEKIRKTLEEAGASVLLNEAVALGRPSSEARDAEQAGEGEALYLVGIGPHFAGKDLVKKALADVPDGAPRVAMMHHPDSFALFPAHSASFAVAGHTHGGQFRVPGFPEWSYLSLLESGEVAVDGWIDDYGAPGNRLYVNRGIGMSDVPIRINCLPELTFFVLRAPRNPNPDKP